MTRTDKIHACSEKKGQPRAPTASSYLHVQPSAGEKPWHTTLPSIAPLPPKLATLTLPPVTTNPLSSQNKTYPPQNNPPPHQRTHTQAHARPCVCITSRSDVTSPPASPSIKRARVRGAGGGRGGYYGVLEELRTLVPWLAGSATTGSLREPRGLMALLPPCSAAQAAARAASAIFC